MTHQSFCVPILEVYFAKDFSYFAFGASYALRLALMNGSSFTVLSKVKFKSSGLDLPSLSVPWTMIGKSPWFASEQDEQQSLTGQVIGRVYKQLQQRDYGTLFKSTSRYLHNIGLGSWIGQASSLIGWSLRISRFHVQVVCFFCARWLLNQPCECGRATWFLLSVFPF